MDYDTTKVNHVEDYNAGTRNTVDGYNATGNVRTVEDLTHPNSHFKRSSANTNIEYYRGWNPIDTRDDEYASKTYAQIINQQYADYRRRFLPREEQLMSLADSTQLLDEQLGRINTNIATSYDGMSLVTNPVSSTDGGQFTMFQQGLQQSSLPNQQAVLNQRYGVSNTNEQLGIMERSKDLNKALAIAHAKNNTRTAIDDTQNGILTGASTSQNAYSKQINNGG